MKPYNPRIIESLSQNTEILTKLRSDFESVHNYMIEHSRFESSTFQENKGISSIPKFQGKVGDLHSVNGKGTF